MSAVAELPCTLALDLRRHCRSAAVHRTSTSFWLSDSYSCEFGFVCQWWLLSSSFQCGYGAFDRFFPFPKSNSASQYANDDGQRPTSIVDLTARVPCRFFYFRGARQLWALYRQPAIYSRREGNINKQTYKTQSFFTLDRRSGRAASHCLWVCIGRSAIWRWRRDFL